MGSSPTIRIELNRKNAGNSMVSGIFFYSKSLHGTLMGQIVFNLKSQFGYPTYTFPPYRAAIHPDGICIQISLPIILVAMQVTLVPFLRLPLP